MLWKLYQQRTHAPWANPSIYASPAHKIRNAKIKTQTSQVN